ncbi:MAG: serine--tRNA ligase [Alphaproteobacteria bacterium]|nr:serine--tRNA ligase [Alphaproteobacteria bacterium]MDA7986913.1 serine--tRNA ligase [Alphaproteobacteria bacterium]MDA7999783.1 serine--tRNA ligase [Alphaproteobacteria bacterium]MDA8003369.1 serine--tRNA ligase [Alphaproteobacteria bacterium]MDA8005119.1 serine--tRNA ligase [Alphaproteobacteria bacterium]
MLDLRLIRGDPARLDAALARRGLEPASAEILALDEKRRRLLSQAQEAQAERNRLSKEIGQLRAQGKDTADASEKVVALRAAGSRLEGEAQEISDKLRQLLEVVPNFPDDEVPDGANEDDNRLETTWGEQPQFAFAPREHWDIGQTLGAMDFDRATHLSGARFVVLHRDLARLHRALAQYMLDIHTAEHGYDEVQVPHLVRGEAIYGTGQLPKFAEDLFQTTDGRWLIPTAEVSLSYLYAADLLDEDSLPLRLTAATACYRSEAGAAGRDTRGMLRQHQFDKVELVSVTAPDESADELERMRQCAETVLQRLALPYRVVTLCTGDMGFAAARTYDLEVWLPGQGRYREISSCSNCRDFQARRMGAKYRPRAPKSKPDFVHTLNGSGVAVGRALIAVLENRQQGDGSVVVPEVLRPYMNGREVITPAEK